MRIVGATNLVGYLLAIALAAVPAWPVVKRNPKTGMGIVFGWHANQSSQAGACRLGDQKTLLDLSRGELVGGTASPGSARGIWLWLG